MSKPANVAPPPRLYVVTSNAQQAAIDLFHCDLELVPAWARIVSEVVDLAAIPTKAKVINRWYGEATTFEQVWREERTRREFDMDYAAHVAALEAWHDKRWADALANFHFCKLAPSVSAPAAEPVSPVLTRKSRWS